MLDQDNSAGAAADASTVLDVPTREPEERAANSSIGQVDEVATERDELESTPEIDRVERSRGEIRIDDRLDRLVELEAKLGKRESNPSCARRPVHESDVGRR